MIITLFVTRIYWQILFSPSSKYFHINSQRQLVIFLLSIISSAGQHNLSHNHTLCMKGEAKSICLPNDYVKVMLRIAYENLKIVNNNHLVSSLSFPRSSQSLCQLEWISRIFPKFRTKTLQSL